MESTDALVRPIIKTANVTTCANYLSIALLNIEYRIIEKCKEDF